MRGRRYKPKHNTSHEFELDLAPLLAVMVKLVPVLLVSSAFVQIMIVETELPQVVKEAIERQEQDKNPKKTTIALDINHTKGIQIRVDKEGGSTSENIPILDGGKFDLPALQLALQKVKTENPETFRIEFNPDSGTTNKELVKLMDEVRRSRDKQVNFVVFDQKQNKEVETDYMFPDVVFANILE